MRTIGRRWPEVGPDRVAMCSYCGVQWRRSQLTRDASGNLACPDDAPGLDIVSLSEGNARLMRSRQPKTVGPTDGNFDQFTPPASPGFVNPNGPPPPAPPNTGPTGPLSVVVNMWLRSDVVEQNTVAGRVSKWTDQSNRGNPVTPTGGLVSREPIYVTSDATLGGLPTLLVDGTKGLSQVTYRGGAPLWAWIICKQNAYTSGTLVTAGMTLAQGTVPGALAITTNAGTSADNMGAAIGDWARIIVSFNIAGFDTLQVKASGVSLPSAGQRETATMSLFFALFGSFAEILMLNGPPTTEERAAIEAYGVARYGGGLFA